LYHVNKLSQAEAGFAPVKFRAPLIHLEEHFGTGTFWNWYADLPFFAHLCCVRTHAG
jgi:hypothetical protein